MLFKAHVDIAKYSGMAIPSIAHTFVELNRVEEIPEVLQKLGGHEEKIHILGEGTNTIWGSSIITRPIIKINIPGFEVIEEKPDAMFVEIGAGENWDKVVEKVVNLGLAGIEALSAIPGTAGATPVQNVGAYGADISQTLHSLRAYDIEEKKMVTISANECNFTYRGSMFKGTAKKRFIITSILLSLSKKPPQIPDYKDTKAFFEREKKANPTLQEIRGAIIEIRKLKLPDPSVIPNCGSFFKNPIVPKMQADELKEKFPNMPHYPDPNGVKISAGWMIEKAGLKGKSFGRIATYPNNALVLTSLHKDAQIDDLLSARDKIVTKVKELFDVNLEMEPEIIS